jgi:hypothetical protein
MLRNQWTLCAGIGGRLAPERADGFAGIHTRIKLESEKQRLKEPLERWTPLRVAQFADA